MLLNGCVVDDTWVRLSPGEEPNAPLVRNVRSPGGMIIGRITTLPGSGKFTPEVYYHGQWKTLGIHDDFKGAVSRVVNPAAGEGRLVRR